MPEILDGNRVRDELMRELKPRVASLAALGRPPGLAVVLVGHNPASEIYVRNKVRTCEELGILSETIRPAQTATTEEVLELLKEEKTEQAVISLVEKFSDVNDPVKFAKWIPAMDASESLITIAREIVQKTGEKTGKKTNSLMWLDKESGLMYQMTVSNAAGKEQMKMVMSDYRNVFENIKMPYITEIYTKDKLTMKTTVKSIKVNQGIADSMFDVESSGSTAG